MKQKAELKFWDNNPALKRIALINPGDFSIIGSLESLNFIPNYAWKSMGICDPIEIRERNNLMEVLFNNPDVRARINKIYENRRKLDLPTNENDFLCMYSQAANPYWDAVKEVVADLSRLKVTGRLQSFLSELESHLPMAADEQTLSRAVSARLQGVAVMEGVFSVDVALDVRDKIIEKSIAKVYYEYIHGYKLFSAAYSPSYTAEIPKWLKNRTFRWLGITAKMQKIANKAKAEAAKLSSVINSFSVGLRRDLSEGFENSILPYFHPKSGIVDGGIVTFDLYFNYSERGLYIRPLSVSQSVDKTLDWEFASKLSGLDVKQQKFLIKKQISLVKAMSAAAANVKSYLLFSCFSDKFFGEEYRVQSSGTDLDYRWFAIGHVYRHRQWKETHQRVSVQRKYFFDMLQQIVSVSDILEGFERKARALKSPLCIPKISFVEHSGVSFANLAPISLAGKTDELVPITLERINGQIVGLTGRHGGGKTVAGKTILESVYLALSGLPVFAEQFTTDVKTVLGAVTNDEGEGSTATVFVNKVKNLMVEINNVPVHESLVFIDEIGKGTQQEAGLQLGQAILTALSRGGNSVLFNTQILELAEYAERHLNAVCYKVNKEHQFVKGIAGGEIMDLVKEVGLDQYLRN